MSIIVKCPNGHELKVKDKYAGQTGLCPRCNVRVLVPTPVAVTEDSVMDFVGPPVAEDQVDLPVHQDPRHLGQSYGSSSSGSSLLGSSILARPRKTCPKCRKEVAATYDLCPYCHTYFSDVNE